MWKLLLVLYCLLTLSGCEKSPVTAGTSGTAPLRQKITFALTTQPQSTLVHIALKNGYFSDQGLDVLPLVHSFGKAALLLRPALNPTDAPTLFRVEYRQASHHGLASARTWL